MSGIVSDNTDKQSGLIKTPVLGPDSGSSDPTVSTNPSAAGDRFINTTSGELFVCTDATTDENVWKGQLGTTVQQAQYQGPRGIRFGGSPTSGSTNVIDYVTIASTGNASDFGDLTVTRAGRPSAASNRVRGICGGGKATPTYDVVDYIVIASTGNATDFGDLSAARYLMCEGLGDGTKGLLPGGSDAKTIDYFNIASTGNATDFGDFAYLENSAGSASNGTRGIWAGGDN